MLQLLLLPAAIVSSLVDSVSAQEERVDFTYAAPPSTPINNLSAVLNTSGVYGFIFNTSQTPSTVPYGTYNWCNMPHVRAKEYPKPSDSYNLRYVEVIHRHHKRTPYASNTFPVETQKWDCSNADLFVYGQPDRPRSNDSATTYWRYYQSDINPFRPTGFSPFTCAFPQITRKGLDDSYQHGADLYGVYHDLLRLIPDDDPFAKTVFRVTNNQITSQVAGMLIAGMFADAPTRGPTQLSIQQTGVDSLEPQYSCPRASSLFSSYATGSTSPAWTEHLTRSSDLFARLDAISGIAPSNYDWHRSYDHYFDNLSARLCHQKPLPCNTTTSACVSQADAESVFRLGQYEYAFTYRSAGNQTLAASTASYGIWLAELAQHLRDASAGADGPVYRHNVAHDGSVSRLLSILQLANMVWPGMGSEVVFELWQRQQGAMFVRILWGGQPLKSSSRALQAQDDMIPLRRFLGYVDGLVGSRASNIRQLCGY